MPVESTSRKKPSSGEDEASGSKSSSSSFAVGSHVEVDCSGSWKPASVTHRHHNGTFSVKLDATDQVEKHVTKDRLRRAKDKDKNSEQDKPSSSHGAKSKRSKHDASDDEREGKDDSKPEFDPGEEVFYLVRQEGAGGGGGGNRESGSVKWSLGRIQCFRNDGAAVDLTNSDTNELVKKVPLKDLRKTRKIMNKDANIEPDTYVKYKTKADGESSNWRAGFVLKSHHTDQSVDIAHESDQEQVDKRVPKKLVRLCEQSPAKSKQKSNHKRKQSSGAENDEEDASASEGDDDQRQNKTRNLKLQVGQAVTFTDDKKVQHCGKVKQVRQDDLQADIVHDSDSEHISKRVAFRHIKPVSQLGRLLPSRPLLLGNSMRQRQVIEENTRVLVATGTDGQQETKGIVVKKWKDGSFDVRTMDGQLLKRVDGSKLTVLTLTAALFGGIQMSMPKWSLLGGTTFYVGQQVRFRASKAGGNKRSRSSASSAWLEGVVVRVKKNNQQYVVEFQDDDGNKSEATLDGQDLEATQTALTNVLEALLPNTTTVFQVGSFVEVTKNQRVHQAMITRVNDDGTYGVEYADGKTEHKVKADKLRLCLRRLRIGTEVEFVIEGPCKEVSKLEGEVAWVHRDEKVAVRVNCGPDGSNDIFAEVSSHALTVNGQSASKAPVTSTWRELMAFWFNLLLELVVYAWICFGLLLELNEMLQLLQQTSPAKFADEHYMQGLYLKASAADAPLPHHGDPEMMNKCLDRLADNELLRLVGDDKNGTRYVLASEDFLATQRAWLVALIIVKAICAAVSTLCAARVIHFKFTALQDKLIDVREYQRDRVLRRVLSQALVVTILVCFVSLLCVTSFLNAMEYLCVFSSDPGKMLRLDLHALHVPLFDFTPVSTTLVDLLVLLGSTSVFHLYRVVALYFVLFGVDSLLFRLLFAVPSVLVSCLISAVAMASLHVFFYVRKYSFSRLDQPSLNYETNLALFQVLATLWIAWSFGRVLFSVGKYLSMATERMQSTRDITEDIMEQAERGEFGLQAKKEAALAKLELDQQQLGIWRLIILQVHQRLVFHLTACVYCIVVDGGLLQRLLAKLDSELLVFTNLHLAICCSWLLVSLGCWLAALRIAKEFPVVQQRNILKNL